MCHNFLCTCSGGARFVLISIACLWPGLQKCHRVIKSIIRSVSRNRARINHLASWNWIEEVLSVHRVAVASHDHDVNSFHHALDVEY